MISGPRSSDVVLVAASGVSGIAGAAFVLISRGALGLTEFAPVAQLWTIWSLAAASLLFAYQQWAIQAGVTTMRSAVSNMKGAPLHVFLCSVLGSGLILVLFRFRLFHVQTFWWPAAGIAILVGTTFIGIARGVLAVANRNLDLGISVAGENLIRCSLAAVIVGFGGSRGLYAVALISGFAVVGLVDRGVRSPTGTTFAVVDLSVSSAASAGFISISAFLMPTILLAYNGAIPDQVSTLFLVLTAVRLPHLVLQSGTPKAGALFSRWTANGDVHRIGEARRFIFGGALLAAALSAGIGYLAGDLLVGPVFGIRGKVEASTYALAAAASLLSLGATIATVLLLAENRNRLVVFAWFFPTAISGFAAIAFGVVSLSSITIGMVVLHLVVLGLLGGAPLLFHEKLEKHR
jgi:hypothetical protein